MNAFPPARWMRSMQAASTGSSGGLNGSLSITTTDNWSPFTSTPSQNVCDPTRIALGVRRNRSRSSFFEAQPRLQLLEAALHGAKRREKHEGVPATCAHDGPARRHHRLDVALRVG